MKAFVFPGQGAQFVGMGKDLYENNALAKELFEKACRKLGKICLKEIYAQNHRESEYIQVPED